MDYRRLGSICQGGNKNFWRPLATCQRDRFMGSGKSSVAKKLSNLLKMPILKMDELVLQIRRNY